MISDHALHALFGGRVAPDGTPVARNFAAWFGQSQIVDGSGMPLVVLHGTVVDGTTFDAKPGLLPRNAFRSFDTALQGAVTDTSDARAGFWFTSGRERALAAAADAKAMSHGGSAYVYELFLRMERPLHVGSIDGYSPDEIARLARRAKREGFDGLIFRSGEMDGSDYLAFDPSQVKSATQNSGAFSRDDIEICDRSALDPVASLRKASAERALGIVEVSPRPERRSTAAVLNARRKRQAQNGF